MAGYTRQSTASILNGQAITAPPLTAEFNQLASAFNASSGHTHDGSTGNSNKINLVTSVTGFLPAANGGIGGKNKSDATAKPVATNDASEGFAVGSVWTNVSTGRVYICIVNTNNSAVWRELVQVTSGNSILPDGTDTVDLGSNGVRFQDLFLSGGISAALNVAVGGTLNVTGLATVGGTLGVTGLATMANLTATGTTTITSIDLNSGAIDSTTIGTSTPAAGTFTTLNANTSLVAATADINGGTVDGATIGASTPSTGSFTTLGASGTTTLATVDINAGAIDGTTIGASSHTTGKFTTLQSTGAATLASVNIDGGAIDGTTIGASATSSGAFTTVTASGGFTGALAGNVTGNTAGVHTGAVSGNVTGNLTGNVTASSGSSTFTDVVVNGTLNMNAGTSATITNLTAPSSDLDAATKKYVDDEISTLVGDAGAGLNTLGELADALNDDDAFSTTVTNSIATKLPKAGGTMTGAIAMGTSKITGLGDPTANQDASTKAYTDAQRNTRLATAGGTMSGAIAMGNNKVTGLATPTAGTDATTKTYVDTIHGSAVAAATSASNASTSASNASTSENNASNSATASANSATSAAASLDLFDDRFLGAKSSAPSVDNDGNALVVGTLYFDTTASAMKVYSGSGWVNAGSSVNGTTNRFSYTATANQTVFSATYDAGFVDVFLNGVKQLVGTDVTATSGTSVVFASGTSVNDIVEIVGYGTFVLADHPTQTQADARYVNLTGNTMTGNLTVPQIEVGDGSAGGNSEILFSDNASSRGKIKYNHGSNPEVLTLETTGTVGVSIDNQQNVSIPNGNLVVSGLVDGVDIAARDAVLTSTTNTANAALPKVGGTLTGPLNITQSSTADTIRLTRGATSNNSIIKFKTGSADKWIVGQRNDSTDHLRFYSYGTSSDVLSIQTDGKVGIGDTAPLDMLSISSASGNSAIRLKRTDTAILNDDIYGTINFAGDDSDSNASGIRGFIRGKAQGTGGGMKMEFGTAGGGVAIGSARMTLNADGNLGIGTAAPAAPLQVDTDNGFPALVLSRDGGVSGRRPFGIGMGGPTDATMFINASNDTTGAGAFGGSRVVLMELEAAGDVTIKTGNLKIGTSGKGIDFSARAVNGTDVGGTNETLNDFETGTWTPKLLDINGNEASYQSGYPKGTYIKVGRHVWVNFSIRITSKGSMTGSYVFVANLPFNKDVTAEGRGTGTIDYYSGFAANKSYLALDCSSTVSVLWLVGGTNATGSHYVTPAHLGNSCMFKGGANYTAT